MENAEKDQERLLMLQLRLADQLKIDTMEMVHTLAPKVYNNISNSDFVDMAIEIITKGDNKTNISLFKVKTG